MKKKWLLGILTAGTLLGAGLVACGSGSVEAPGDLDEMYVDTFVENINNEVDKAIEACESDPMCASGLPSVAPSSDSKDDEDDDKEETPESSSATAEPASSSATATVNPTPTLPVESSSSAVDIPPGAISPVASSSSAAIVTPTPTISSSSAATVTPTPTVSSSSAAQVTPVVSSSSAATVTPVVSSSSAAVAVDPSGATEVVLNYDGELTELPAGKYSLTSTNQWSGSLACQASATVTVTVDGVEATVGTELNNVGNAKPTGQNAVILIVPEGATISCKTRW